MNFLTPLPPRLVAVGGFSGSGKTAVAGRIASGSGRFSRRRPPAQRPRTQGDVRRRSPGRLPDAAYQSDVKSNIYARLLDRGGADHCLPGNSVIIDATFLAEADRQAVSDLVSTFAGDVTVTPF